jgi:hypothetical protein
MIHNEKIYITGFFFFLSFFLSFPPLSSLLSRYVFLYACLIYVPLYVSPILLLSLSVIYYFLFLSSQQNVTQF